MENDLRLRAWLRNAQPIKHGATLLEFEFLAVVSDHSAEQFVDDIGKSFEFAIVPKRRGAWIEFASDGKRVADILHEPKDAIMPDSFVWCEEIGSDD